MSPAVPHGTLTRYETRVVALLAQGCTQRQAATRLHVSYISIRNAITRAMRRLDATSSTHLVARAIALRIIPAGTALTDSETTR